MSTPTLQTSFDFVLPRGYVDMNGTVHREGTMRLATARDELMPLIDPKVQQHDAFMTLVLLSRVVTRLGTLPQVDDQVIGGLWATDLAFLQDLYRRINTEGTTITQITCPHCQGAVTVDLAGDAPGES